MFSLTKGKPIAKTDNTRGKINILSIIDTDNDKPKKKTIRGCGHGGKYCCRYCDEEYCQDEPCCKKCKVYYDDSTESESSEDDIRGNGIIGKEFKPPKNMKLLPIPDLTDRFVDYIAGPSGSGKSTVTAMLANQFQKIFPLKPVYIFSRTDAKDDPAFKGLKRIHQIHLDDSIVEDPIDIVSEIKEGGALMIFDDCNTIQNDKIKKEVEKLMADAMEVGRKLKCNMIITSHLVVPNEKKMARTILNEMHNLTIFPKSGSSQQIRYALKTYFGMNNHQIDKILATKSRWVRISKTYPQYVLHSGGAYIL